MAKSVEVRRRFWQGIRGGLGVAGAAAAVGASHTWGENRFNEAGGVNPVRVADPVGRYLSHGEREEIMRLDAAGLGVREIARALGRNPSTISRELGRGSTSHHRYRASKGQSRADRSRRGPRRGPRAAKLATNLSLRREVQARLKRPAQTQGQPQADRWQTQARLS